MASNAKSVAPVRTEGSNSGKSPVTEACEKILGGLCKELGSVMRFLDGPITSEWRGVDSLDEPPEMGGESKSWSENGIVLADRFQEEPIETGAQQGALLGERLVLGRSGRLHLQRRNGWWKLESPKQRTVNRFWTSIFVEIATRDAVERLDLQPEELLRAAQALLAERAGRMSANARRVGEVLEAVTRLGALAEPMGATSSVDGPDILGRKPAGSIYARAGTKLAASDNLEFCGGGTGGSTAHVELFESLDDEDRGGIVIRMRLEDPDCSFLPHAVEIPGGLELHLCGDDEARYFADLLSRVLQETRHHR